MRIYNIFYTLQGELDIGRPSVFIRFSGCNLIKEGLSCVFCDTLYAEKGKEMDLKEVIFKALSYKCDNIVITGGESLCQLSELKPLTLQLKTLLEKHQRRYSLDIETNGTLFDDILNSFSNINCSPKKQAINYEVLKKIILLPQSRFKFVYESKECRWWETIINDLKIPDNRVWLMPEGKTREEQVTRNLEVAEYCKEKRYNFSPRLHVLLWDTKRGV